MSDTDKKTDEERNAHIEAQIVSWMRVGYKRHQLITLEDGTVIADPDKYETEAALETLEKISKEQ